MTPPANANPLLADRDWLTARWASTATIADIAAEALADPATVHRWARRHDLPARAGRWAAVLDPVTLRRLMARWGTANAAAAALGCDHRAVDDALARHGLAVPQVGAAVADRLADLYEAEGLAVREVADRLGVSGRTVRRWLRAAGVPTRPPGRPVRHKPT